MDEALKKRLAALDALDSTPAALSVGRALHFSPVEYTREIERVLHLPMRPEGYFSPTMRDKLRQSLTRPDATMALWDVQCAALLAALDVRTDVHPERRTPGLFGAVSVGGGKTLVAALLGTVWQVSRVVVLTNASLRAQTEAEIDKYKAHFFITAEVIVIPYSMLSNVKHVDILHKLSPGAIVADEAHSLRNAKSARGRRIRRYLKAKPGTYLAALTGTIARKSLMDWAELSDLALGDWSPAPRDYPTRKAWAQALDDEPARGIGALNLLSDGGGTALAVRQALAARIARGAGCVASMDDKPDIPINVRIFTDPTSDLINAAMMKLLNTWCRPDGEELSLAAEFAEVNKQLRLGGYYGWKTEPDREWLHVRRLYKRALREWINRHPSAAFDSMFAVETQLRRGHISIPEFNEWESIRERAKEPPKVWRWVDEAVAEWWAQRLGQSAAIGFGQRIAFARRVAELAGTTFYEGGNRKHADALRAEDGSRSIVASLSAYKKGQNLQAFERACVFDAPTSGSDWEQLLGRLHRPGQTATCVTYEISKSFLEELGKAQTNTDWLSSTDGKQYRLQSATIQLIGDSP